MEAKVAHTLIHFAIARENALRIAGALSGAKLEAITKIKQKAEYFKSQPAPKQLEVVKQVEPELLLILPHEKSRFHKMRKNILELIGKCHD